MDALTQHISCPSYSDYDIDHWLPHVCWCCVSHHVHEISIAGMQEPRISHFLESPHIVNKKWGVFYLLTPFCGRRGSSVHVALDCNDHAFTLF